jgi:transposase-like protein
MGLSRRIFTREMKLAAVQRLETGSAIAEVARALEVNPNVLHRWRREFRQGPGNAFPGFGRRRWDDTQQAKLERRIGQQTLEIDFLKSCLQRIEEQRMLQALTGKPDLPEHPRASPEGSGHERSRDVRSGPVEPRWLLPVSNHASGWR